MVDIVRGGSVEAVDADVFVAPMHAGVVPGPGTSEILGRLGDWVDAYAEASDYRGEANQLLSLPVGGSGFDRIGLVGLGDEADAEVLRRAAATAAGAVTRHETVATTLHLVDVDGAGEYVAFGFELGQYRFSKYQSEPKPVATTTLVLAGADEAAMEAAGRGQTIAAAVALARDLINEPAVAKPPVELAARAVAIAERHGLESRVYDETEFEAEGFGGLAAVNAGADNPGRMVVLKYRPEGAERSLVFVGKGIVFDSGGLSLKPASAMEAMKTDMSGAAAVLAAMDAIAALRPDVNVTVITPLTENVVSGSAQRPGDVLKARNGKTIEVLNTDAEGRLVLADGLSLAAELKPDLIVDVATLTGACSVALGPKIGGLFASDDEAAAAVLDAAWVAGEKLWRLPLEAEYKSHIESTIADMKNTGERYGGAISAALLLAEFAGDGPWVHLDIAGPARSSAAEHYVTKGGTGFAVRTLVELATAT
jgi:leucyl aminopeptidase